METRNKGLDVSIIEEIEVELVMVSGKKKSSLLTICDLLIDKKSEFGFTFLSPCLAINF